MSDYIEHSIYLGSLISIGSYAIGMWLNRITKSTLANPLLISITLVIVFILTTGISTDTYRQQCSIISYMLTPATVCLAVPLYEQMQLLKRNYKAVISGIAAGTLASLCCVLLMAIAIGLSHESYVTLLPKSITTPIGIGISEELGGIVPVTVVCIVITGVLGNVFAEKFLKLIHVDNPIAKGIAIGTSSHIAGTAKAIEMGRIEGATSGLSIVVAGMLTVIGASVFAMLW